MIEATYQRDKKLRIRKEPSTEGEIIGFMEPNESAEVLEVVDGWCKIDGGYIMESLVVLTDDDEAAELRKMTNPQLYELCVNSGIKVKKNASKDAMIAALTNPDA